MEELLRLALEGVASRKADNGEDSDKKTKDSPKVEQKMCILTKQTEHKKTR